MKKKIQVLLIFLIVIIGLGILSANQVFAEDNYSISIGTISYASQPNVLTRNVPPTPDVVANHENVQVEKSCYVGEAFSLTAIIVPSNAYVGEVVWTIEQETEVAKIASQNGLTATIVGVHAGTCNIVCTAADGQGAYTTCKLTVYQKATKIVLNPAELILKPGDTQQLIATVLPEDTSDKTLLWESSNEDIATVDENGVVMAVAPSEEPVKITVTALDGSNVSTTATIYVRVMVETLEWEKFSNVIYKNGNNTETFAVKVNPEHATIPTLKYSTSDPSVATVLADSANNNHVIVTPKKPGKFTLTAETTDGSNLKLSAEVEVVQLVEHIALNTTEKILFLEDGKVVTHQVIATALPANATILGGTTEDKFIWKSSDENIATVDKNGLVTAIAPGTAIITCTANDVGATSATCKIHVRKAVTSLEIDLYTFEYIDQSATSAINLLEKLKYLNGVAFMYSGEEVALNAKFNQDATLTTLMWQIPGVAKDANNTNIIGVFAKLSNAYTNPTILTALPLNQDNAEGYLNVTINCKATDGSGITAQRVVQIRQPATSVEFSKSNMTLYAPDSGIAPSSEKIVATILPQNAYVNSNPDAFTDGAMVWVSSDPSVATVNEHGLVTAVAPGEATIIGTVADGKGAMNVCTVTVIQPVKSISIYTYQDDNKVILEDAGEDINSQFVFAYTNQSIRLHADTLPSNATNNKLTWSSSDPDVAKVENGFLVIGSKATASVDAEGYLSADSNFVLIRAATTDGSGIEFRIRLYVLDAGYKVELEEFISLNAGDYEKLLLKVFKTQTEGDKLITTPIPIDATIKLSGDVIGSGDDAITVLKMFDSNGTQIKDGHTLTNVLNPSFDVQGVGSGLATVTFNVALNEIESNLSNAQWVLVGNSLSFERSCTIKVTGIENRHISMKENSMSMIVGQQKQVTAVVTPSNASNFYIKYSLTAANEDYPNPYKYARVDEDTGVISGVGVGQVIVVATLFDSESNQPIKYEDEIEQCEMPVYISAALSGVEMNSAVVYVGEQLNLLNLTTVFPEVLNDSLIAAGEKSSVVKFETLSGSGYISWDSNNSIIVGKRTGNVVIKAIAQYQGKVVESLPATISVKERLTGITLTKSLTLKLNQITTLTPRKIPLVGDVSRAKITWSSANSKLVEVEPDWKDNGFTGIITAKGETDKKGVDVTVTIQVNENSAPITAKCNVVVIGVKIDDFSAENNEYRFKLGKTDTEYYKYGAYNLTKTNGSNGTEIYSAGCLENGAFSLTTPYLYNSGEASAYRHSKYNYKDNTYTYVGTYTYPSIYPLKTWMALERVEQVMYTVAEGSGWIYDIDGNGTIDDAEREKGFTLFIQELNAAIQHAVALGRKIDDNNTEERYDADAYLELPPKDGSPIYKSHFLTKEGSVYKKKNFDKWGYGDKGIYVLTGLSAQWEKKNGQTLQAIDVVRDNAKNFKYTPINGDKIANTYFSSALTALNVISGDADIVTRQSNALSIILTYFPIDEMNLDTWDNKYQLYHAARQVLTWAASGIKTDKTYATKLKDQKYVFTVPNYAGQNMYYVVFMLQAEDEDDSSNTSDANYMEYPHGYSKFYYACSNILASRFKKEDKLEEVMGLIEGFVWKLDQVKHRTIPSFAYEKASLAQENPHTLVWSAEAGAYTTTVVDENGVLNYFHFDWKIPNVENGVTFSNNGDGTLTIKVTKEAKDYIVEHGGAVAPPAKADLLPENNEYSCAAFVKWEMETEICQVPYTDASGNLRYAYLLGQNAQSQIFAPKAVYSGLGDPLEAYIAFAFDDVSTDEYESMVTSNVYLLDWNLNPTEYVIPGEQYVLKYTYQYRGDSRSLFFKTIEHSANSTSPIYGFAADMRARTNRDKSLKFLKSSFDNGGGVIKSTISGNSSDVMYELWIDKTDVDITGSFAVLETPYGAVSEEWSSENNWDDTLYINAVTEDAVYCKPNGSTKTSVTENIMKNSSKYPNNVEVSYDKSTGEVIIDWTFYSGYITLSTPYIKASADISIGEDMNPNHIARTIYNSSADAEKYIYGLTLDGEKAVVGQIAQQGEFLVRDEDEYIEHYEFTGLVASIVDLYSQYKANKTTVSPENFARTLFQDTAYVYTEETSDGRYITPFAALSIEDLQTMGAGARTCSFGNAVWFKRGDEVRGYGVNIGKHTTNRYDFFVWWRASDGSFDAGFMDDMLDQFMNCTSTFCDYQNYVPAVPDGDDGEGMFKGDSTAKPKFIEGITTNWGEGSGENMWHALTQDELANFTMTNHEYYGGLGYFIPTDDDGSKDSILKPITTKNALNSSSFHTDKTWQTTFDLSIENLVVNTGAGITSPTMVDTRNFVNLNIYYTVNLKNDTYKQIVNRYGLVGAAWRQFYKASNSDENEVEYYYRKQDFYRIENNVKKWCSYDYAPKYNQVLYFVKTNLLPEITPVSVSGGQLKYKVNTTGSEHTVALTDCYYIDGGQKVWCTSNMTLAELNKVNGLRAVTSNAIFRDAPASANIAANFIPNALENSSKNRPAGYANEKGMPEILHTDVFVDFSMFDNATIADEDKLDPATFISLSSKEQLDVLTDIADSQSTTLVFVDNIQTGKNYIQHSAPHVFTSIESGLRVFGFTAHVNQMNDGSAGILYNSKPVTVSGALAEWDKPNDHPLFQEYIPAYDNNGTATAMLQYPSYNPYTLSTTSTNGSLVYKNSAGVEGFDIVLGNNQSLHIPNSDTVNYNVYNRVFNNGKVNNGTLFNAYPSLQMITTNEYGRHPQVQSVIPEATINGNLMIPSGFKYNSLNFYKYSATNYALNNLNGDGVVVKAAPAETIVKNDVQTESYKITSILFRSTYTVSRKLGTDGWVDITDGSNPDALVNAGKGFELKIQVTYTNSNLTEYLNRYAAHSPQLGVANSATSDVTQTHCNISSMTGHYGESSIKDLYTSKVTTADDEVKDNDVFGTNLFKDIYVVMNNNNKYVYSHSGVYGTTNVFDVSTEYEYLEGSSAGKIVLTYTMKLSPVNGYFGNTSNVGDSISGLATQNMKFYTDSAAAGTVGSLTIWTNPLVVTPFDYPNTMKDRYIADLKQIQYFITSPVDNVDNIVQ